MTPNDASGSLQRAWRAALGGRGGLALVAGASRENVADALEPLTAAAIRDGAELRRGLGESGARSASDGERFAAFARAAEALRDEARARPILWIVEDLAAAPVDALRLLAFLGRELRESAVLIVAVRAGDLPSPDPDRARVLADLARAGEWISIADPDLPASPPPRNDEGTAGSLTLVRDGRLWVLSRGARSVRLRDTRGLAYLARLITEPGRALRAVDLAERDEGDAGEALDVRARETYRRRLASGEDVGRAEAAFIARELARGAGLGGRVRRSGSGAERARVAVTRGIRRALARIAEQDLELGRWLEARVSTGHVCIFAAEVDAGRD